MTADGVDTTARAIAAVAAVAQAARALRDDRARRLTGAAGAVAKVALATRETLEETTRRLRDELAPYSFSLSPDMDIPWEPFEWFGLERHEPSWTQWLASLLQASAPAWEGFCRAVARADLERRDRWLAAARERPTVVPEEFFVFDEEGKQFQGSCDLVVRSSLVAIVENKIDAGWNDTPEEAQNSKYARYGRRIGAESKLVLAPARDFDSRGWPLVTYGDLAREWRIRLHDALARRESCLKADTLAPLAATVRAVEKHVLGVTWPAAEAPWTRATARQWMRLHEALGISE